MIKENLLTCEQNLGGKLSMTNCNFGYNRVGLQKVASKLKNSLKLYMIQVDN